MSLSNPARSSSVNLSDGSILHQGFSFAPPAHRRKLTIVINQTAEPGTIDIQMTIPLDGTIPAEQKATVFGKKLDVQYTVRVNLAAEQELMTQAVNALFSDPATRAVILALPLRRMTAAEALQCFSKIAGYGASLYYRLFQRLDHDPDFKYPSSYAKSDWPILSDAIRSALSRPQVISMTSHIPLFPWNFLYHDETYSANKASLDLSRFWGFFHEVQDELPGMARRFELSSDPGVVTAICSILDDGKWHQTNDHPLNARDKRPIPVSTTDELGRQLADLPHECFYFFGHARHQNPPTPVTSTLELNSGTLSVHDLEQTYHAPKYHANPVVGFLNGCSTAPLQHWNNDSIVGYLSNRGDGRLCCIATTADVPAMFGAEFAVEFWKQFIENKREIGKSLLEARCEMLNRYNNALGLMYSLYGRADTHLRT